MNYLDIIIAHFSADNAKHISLVAVILYSVICRLNLLDESSKTTIKIFYVSLGFLVALSLKLCSHNEIIYGLSVISLCLLFDSVNWKNRQPTYAIDPLKRRLFL